MINNLKQLGIFSTLLRYIHDKLQRCTLSQFKEGKYEMVYPLSYMKKDIHSQIYLLINDYGPPFALNTNSWSFL